MAWGSAEIGVIVGVLVLAAAGAAWFLRRGERGRAAAFVGSVAVLFALRAGMEATPPPAKAASPLFEAWQSGCLRSCEKKGRDADTCGRLCACQADELRAGRTPAEAELLFQRIPDGHLPSMQALARAGTTCNERVLGTPAATP